MIINAPGQNIVVCFTANNARILVNPENIEAYKNMPGAHINPDLTGVLGVPPHFWKEDSGLIVAMSRSERRVRLASIMATGLDNEVADPLEGKRWYNKVAGFTKRVLRLK